MFRRALRAAGSLKIAVPLTAVLAAVCAQATFWEARYGAAAAFRSFYGAWWFTVLWVLLAVNITAALWLRFFSPRRKSPGFYLTHLGVVVILAGGLVGRLWGVEGFLELHAAGPARAFFLGYRDELLLRTPGDNTLHRFVLDVPRDAGGAPAPAAFRIPEADLTVNVLGRVFIADEDRPSSLETHYAFAARKFRHRPRVERGAATGLQAKFVFTGGDKIGTLKLSGGGKTFSFAVAEVLKKKTPLKGTDYTLLVTDYWPNFVLDGSRPTTRDQKPVNPALRLQLRGPPLHSPALKVELVHGRRQTQALLPRASTDAPLERRLRAATVGGELVELAYGRQTFPLNFKVKLEKIEVPRYAGTSRPMDFISTLSFDDDDGGVPRRVRIYMNRPADHPDTWAATLTGTGYRFTQANWDAEDPTYSGLGVFYDPGRPLKWLGALFLVVGLALMFYVRPRERSKTSAAVPPDAAGTLGVLGANTETEESKPAEAAEGEAS